MASYKITTHTVYTGAVSGAVVQWFSTKADAKRYAKTQVALGYYPQSELVADDYKSSKVVHFPSVAVKAFFAGLNF